MRGLRFAIPLTLLVLLAASCGGEDPTISTPTGSPSPLETETGTEIPPVAMVDNKFAPSMLEATPGEEVTIQLRNNGQNPHSFTIDALEIDTGVIESGETAEVTFGMPKEEQVFYCTVHGDSMSGTITPG
jgi:plastocyanin